MELALDPIQRTDRVPIRDGGADHMTATNALQAQLTHQPLYRAASNINALTLELLPDFHDAIALHIFIPDALDFIAQQLVLFGTSASQFGLTGFGCMHVITGRSDLDYPRSEEHTSELQSRENLVCRLLLEKKKEENLSCLCID